MVSVQDHTSQTCEYLTVQVPLRLTCLEAARMADQLTMSPQNLTPGLPSLSINITERAKALLRLELQKRVALPGLQPVIGDTSWAMLLDLYVRNAENKATSVSSATTGSGAPATTALRHLVVLVEEGYVQRLPHSRDERVVLVSLTAKGRDHIESMISKLC